jgi:hypothetical protein
MRTNHKLVNDGYSTYQTEVREPCGESVAQVVTSLIRFHDGKHKHAPVLDIDVPSEWVPSSTPGHAHLYIDVPMTWWRYKRLLKAMAKAGIIEDSYVKVSIARGHTDVRVPWLKKGV